MNSSQALDIIHAAEFNFLQINVKNAVEYIVDIQLKEFNFELHRFIDPIVTEFKVFI